MPPPNGFTIKFRINLSKTFFKPSIVQQKYQRTERMVLNRIGAFVRSDARQSIRKRKKPSRVGSPPSSHNGFLKRGIRFGYEKSRGSVVVGPVKVGGTAGGPNQPRNLEEGGTLTVPKTRGRRARRVPIGARPYMGPAKDKNLPKLPGMWRNAVR